MLEHLDVGLLGIGRGEVPRRRRSVRGRDITAVSFVFVLFLCFSLYPRDRIKAIFCGRLFWRRTLTTEEAGDGESLTWLLSGR